MIFNIEDHFICIYPYFKLVTGKSIFIFNPGFIITNFLLAIHVFSLFQDISDQCPPSIGRLRFVFRLDLAIMITFDLHILLVGFGYFIVEMRSLCRCRCSVLLWFRRLLWLRLWFFDVCALYTILR